MMQKLNEYGAQKNLDPNTIKSAELQSMRKAAIREFDKLVRDIKAGSKQLGNAAGVPSCETAQERDARWLLEVPRIMKKDKCSAVAAIVWGARFQKIPREPITVQRQINNQVFS